MSDILSGLITTALHADPAVFTDLLVEFIDDLPAPVHTEPLADRQTRQQVGDEFLPL